MIIRFSSIGDIVLTSPIVRCVYNQFSNNIHILTKSNFRALYDNSPCVSKVICYDDYLLMFMGYGLVLLILLMDGVVVWVIFDWVFDNL